MSYTVLILRRAQRELADVPSPAYDGLKRAIAGLAEYPRPKLSRKLTSRAGWRIRVGDYRVIYEIDDTGRTVTIVHVGHRRDVYR